jgi:hypothetical protein
MFCGISNFGSQMEEELSAGYTVGTEREECCWSILKLMGCAENEKWGV